MQLQITASFYPRIIFKTRCLFDISWTRILHQISVHPIIHEFGKTLDRWLDSVWMRNLLDYFHTRFILSCCVQLDHFRLILLHCLHFALPFLLLRSCTLLLFVNLFVPSQPAWWLGCLVTLVAVIGHLKIKTSREVDSWNSYLHSLSFNSLWAMSCLLVLLKLLSSVKF